MADFISTLFRWPGSGQAAARAQAAGAAEATDAELLGPSFAWDPLPFDQQQVRVIVLQDSVRRGKTPMFDTHMRTPASRSSTRSSAKDDEAGGAKPRPRPTVSGDLDVLGEMMFGAIPLSMKHDTTKIHYIRSPQQILFTRLFAVTPVAIRDPTSVDSTPATSNPGSAQLGPLGPLASGDTTPMGSFRNRSLTNASVASSLAGPGAPSQLESELLEAVSEETFRPDGVSPPSPHEPLSRSSSFSSTYSARRFNRHRSTSIDFKPLMTALGSSQSLFALDGTATPGGTRQRRLVYTIGCIVRLDDNRALHDLLFSHYALLDSRLRKLQQIVARELAAAVRAATHLIGLDGEGAPAADPSHTLMPFALQMNEVVVRAVQAFRTSLLALYHTPRLQEPLWLSMATFPERRPFLCPRLIRDLCFIVDQFESRRTNNFVAALLTAVLMQHLAWVPTVAPVTAAASTNGDSSLELQAKMFPYNPLWAQLGDLYGAIGEPAVLARTVVVGTQHAVVKRFLRVLSYFVRCAEVFESVEQLEPSSAASDEAARAAARSASALSQDSGQGDAMPPPDLLSLMDSFHEGDGGAGAAGGGAFSASATGAATASVRSRASTVDEGVDRSRTASILSNDDYLSDRLSDARIDDAENPILPHFGAQACRHERTPAGFTDIKMPPTERTRIVPNSSGTGGAPAPPAPQPLKDKSLRSSLTSAAASLRSSVTGGGAPLRGSTSGSPLRASASGLRGSTGAAVALEPPPPYRAEQLFCRSYGRSLLGGYAQQYAPDFVLHGVPQIDSVEEVVRDVRMAVTQHVLDEPVHKAVCLIVDLNEWRCEQIVGTRSNNHEIDLATLAPRKLDDIDGESVNITQRQPLAADFVVQMLASVRGLAELGMPAETCTMHIEDKLRELYHRSILLAEYVNERTDVALTYKSAASQLGMPISDLPLLVAVASTYHPQVALRFSASEQLYGLLIRRD